MNRPCPCPECGAQPCLIDTYVGQQAACADCLDPTPDAGESSRLAGHGRTKDEALADWDSRVAEYLEMNGDG